MRFLFIFFSKNRKAVPLRFFFLYSSEKIVREYPYVFFLQILPKSVVRLYSSGKIVWQAKISKYSLTLSDYSDYYSLTINTLLQSLGAKTIDIFLTPLVQILILLDDGFLVQTKKRINLKWVKIKIEKSKWVDFFQHWNQRVWIFPW